MHRGRLVLSCEKTVYVLGLLSFHSIRTEPAGCSRVKENALLRCSRDVRSSTDRHALQITNIFMKNIRLGLGALALAVGVMGVSAGTALAYRGDPTVQGPYYSAERYEAMEKAFETNDYVAWKELMQNRGRVTQVITAENFAKFAQAHELMEEGKVAEAQKIRQELGLGLRDGSGRGLGAGTCRGGR